MYKIFINIYKLHISLQKHIEKRFYEEIYNLCTLIKNFFFIF